MKNESFKLPFVFKCGAVSAKIYSRNILKVMPFILLLLP